MNDEKNPDMELTADFLRSLPGGKLDDSTYEKLEDLLDRADAPMQDGTRWLSLDERLASLLATRGYNVDRLRLEVGDVVLMSVPDDTGLHERGSGVRAALDAAGHRDIPLLVMRPGFTVERARLADIEDLTVAQIMSGARGDR